MEETLTLFEDLDPEASAVVTRSEDVQSVGVVHHLHTEEHKDVSRVSLDSEVPFSI